MNYKLKIASSTSPSGPPEPYIQAGSGVDDNQHICVEVLRFPAQTNVMYLFGPAGYKFPKLARARPILNAEGQQIGRAVTCSHQKALVLHLETQAKRLYIGPPRA